MQSGANVAGLIGAHHEPVRPDWDCDTCGAQWPCAPAREKILSTWTTVGRALTMSAYFEQACAELPLGQVQDIHRRFLGWIRDAS